MKNFSRLFLPLTAGLFLAASARSQEFFLYENQRHPVPTWATDAMQNGGSYYHFADLDGDHIDECLLTFLQGYDPQPKYFKMVNGEYVQRFNTDSPFNDAPVSSGASLNFIDLDGDGDLDCVAGDRAGYVVYYPNDGTPTQPHFYKAETVDNPFGLLHPDSNNSSPVTCTFFWENMQTKSGTLYFIGTWPGKKVRSFKVLNDNGSISLERLAANVDPFTGYDTSAGSGIYAFDYNGDEYVDFITTGFALPLTQPSLVITRSPYSGGPTAEYQLGEADPFAGYSAPPLFHLAQTVSFSDLDGDGDLDIFHMGQANFLQRRGNRFVHLSNAPNPFSKTEFNNPHQSLTAGDLNGDGKMDLILGADDGKLKYYLNDGITAAAHFTLQSGAANAVGTLSISADAHPALCDVDQDMDLDLLVGGRDGDLKYYENTGTTNAPIFSLRTGVNNPFDGVSASGNSFPAFWDFNTDGLPDLFLGGSEGKIRCFRNVGVSSQPDFAEALGALNPCHTIDVGFHAAPTFFPGSNPTDLAYLIVGSLSGQLFAYEPVTGPTGIVFTGRPREIANEANFLVLRNRSQCCPMDLDGEGAPELLVTSGNGLIRALKWKAP